jgi:N utilization substance protein B
VIDEAIDIAKEYGTDDSYRFINGVLDAIKKDLQGGSGV